MPKYLISFNQQWVGDHSAEWFQSRGPLARAVVAEMKAAGVLVFADGLVEEPEFAIRVELDGEQVRFRDNPYAADDEFLGGMTIVDVANLDEAKVWAGKIAQACGWPQELREFKS